MSDRSIVKAKRRRQALLVVVGVLAGFVQSLGVAAASPIEDSISEADVAPGNLIQNGDFTSNSSGWQPGLGSWLRSDAGFAGDLFALTATGGSLTNVLGSGNEYNKYSLVSQCIPLGSAAPDYFYFAAWANVEGYDGVSDDAAGIDAEAIIQTFTTPDCTGSASFEVRGAVKGSSVTDPQKWRSIEATGGLAGRKSVKVFLSVVGRFPGTHASVRFDKVFLGDAETYSPLPILACPARPSCA